MTLIDRIQDLFACAVTRKEVLLVEYLEASAREELRQRFRPEISVHAEQLAVALKHLVVDVIECIHRDVHLAAGLHDPVKLLEHFLQVGYVLKHAEAEYVIETRRREIQGFDCPAQVFHSRANALRFNSRRTFRMARSEGSTPTT